MVVPAATFTLLTCSRVKPSCVLLPVAEAVCPKPPGNIARAASRLPHLQAARDLARSDQALHRENAACTTSKFRDSFPQAAAQQPDLAEDPASKSDGKDIDRQSAEIDVEKGGEAHENANESGCESAVTETAMETGNAENSEASDSTDSDSDNDDGP